MRYFPKNLIEKIGFETVRQATTDFAISEMARERIARLQPFSSPEKTALQLQQTAEMMDILRNPDPFPLSELPDIELYLSRGRAEGSLISLEGIVEILSVIQTARLIKNFFKAREEAYVQLFSLSKQLLPLKSLEDEISTKVTDQGNLKDDASRELQNIRKNLNKKKNELRSSINRVMSRATKDGMASDEGPTIRNGRMVIPIQAEFKRKIQGFVHDVSSTGQTVYVEPVEALQLNNEIRQLEAEEQREIERILKELAAHIREKSSEIKLNLDALTNIDIIRAKARLSLKLEGEIPVISDNLHVKLKDALNPILLLKNLELKKDEQEKVVPLKLELTPAERCLMITGPNAGGKSVAMKTLGLCVMMNQSGYAIPADPTSELPVFEGLFVDMGDDQSIENDLSTFSSRLKWIRETQERITENSLLLIDEAGAGTDPDEGSALFQAFIEHMMRYNCKIIVTTHHGSLKLFANEHPAAVNGSMEFDQSSLSPTYKFKKGVPGSSYAFEIAQRMNLKEELLHRAREITGSSKNKMESLIAELEAKTQQAAKLKTKYADLKRKSESEINKFKDKRESLIRERDKIREKALKEAKEIIDGANSRIEEAVQKIVEEKKAEKEELKGIRRDVADQKKKISHSLHEIEERKEEQFRDTGEPPVQGDRVRFKDAQTTGKLVEVNGKNAVVQAGGLRLKTKFKNLVKVEETSGNPKKSRARRNVIIDSDSITNRPLKPSLDIRGQRGDEAVRNLINYLDNAVYKGLKEVEIIHGKGDGILKKLVHEHLGQRSDIRDFKLARADRGGDGCTLVELG